MEMVWGGPKSPGMAAAFAACCITVKEPRFDRLETIKGRVRGPTKSPIRIAICLAVFPSPLESSCHIARFPQTQRAIADLIAETPPFPVRCA